MDKIISQPLVSVIMPAYNATAFIGEAVESILNQTYRSFEFFIIDDASTDDTLQIIRGYTDERIQLICKEKNSGYTNSINLALDLAKGKYIARMDADDISLPQRLAKQVAAMEADERLLVLGSNYDIIGTNETVRMPADFASAKLRSFMYVPVAHPTVMIRASVFREYGLRYEGKYEPAEDYDLWTRIIDLGKIENLPESLLCYRQHAQQQSLKRLQALLEAAVEIRERQLLRLIQLHNKTYDLAFAIAALTQQEMEITGAAIKKLWMLLTDLENANSMKAVYEQSLFVHYLRTVWMHYALKFYKPGFSDIGLLPRIQKSAVTAMNLQYRLRLVKRMLV